MPGEIAARAAAHYAALPREGRLPGRCEMRLPEGLAGARVLDLLCRAGKGAFKLADAVGPDGFVLACDPDAGRIAAAEAARAKAAAGSQAWAARVAFRCGVPEDLRTCGAGEASFDVVYVNASLNCAYDLQAALSECARVLAPGGFFWLAGVFACDRAASAAAASAASGNVFACAPTLDGLRAAARAGGFASCDFLDAAPVEPDGADAVEVVAGRSFVAANARLAR